MPRTHPAVSSIVDKTAAGADQQAGGHVAREERHCLPEQQAERDVQPEVEHVHREDGDVACRQQLPPAEEVVVHRQLVVEVGHGGRRGGQQAVVEAEVINGRQQVDRHPACTPRRTRSNDG
eukprot:SAG22_NODE_161_length_16908_cov_39.687965_19_plen_121_part_00